MEKLNKIIDILALVLAVMLIGFVCVGLATYGWLPLRDLPSWVWFVVVLFYVLMLKRRE